MPAAGFNESAYLWIHWQTEKVPEAVDYMNKYYSKDFTYPSFAADFKATFYDPAQWLDIFNSSGAKYIVFVSKHHEGYCNWPSKHAWNWNSMDVGPKRDLLGIFLILASKDRLVSQQNFLIKYLILTLGELFAVTREKSDLKIGLYYSLYEWYNDLYVNDRNSNFTIDDYVQVCQIKDNLVINELNSLLIDENDSRANGFNKHL